jgi:hypothetical protein
MNRYIILGSVIFIAVPLLYWIIVAWAAWEYPEEKD